MARRAFNSFCQAYSRNNNKTVFELKKLHLHNLSKSFGLKSSKSGSDTEKPAYKNLDYEEEYTQTAREKNSTGRLKLRAKRDSAVLKSEFL